MSSEANKAIIRRIPDEVFTQGNLAVADEVIAADYCEHIPLPPGFPTGLAGLKHFVTLLRAAFPDFQYTIDDEIAEGDRVAIRVTARGTHQGDWFGIPATGKTVSWTEMHISRLADGKLVEHWANSDQLGLLQQLGVIPAPGQAGR
jgi:predicted ester cyclase